MEEIAAFTIAILWILILVGLAALESVVPCYIVKPLLLVTICAPFCLACLTTPRYSEDSATINSGENGSHPNNDVADPRSGSNPRPDIQHTRPAVAREIHTNELSRSRTDAAEVVPHPFDIQTNSTVAVAIEEESSDNVPWIFAIDVVAFEEESADTDQENSVRPQNVVAAIPLSGSAPRRTRQRNRPAVAREIVMNELPRSRTNPRAAVDDTANVASH